MSSYAEFLKSKEVRGGPCGFAPTFLPDWLKGFQRHLGDWSIRLGRAAIYADCGLGKSPMSLVWAENVVRHVNRPVLIACPLAVSRQFAREGEKFGIPAKVTQDGKVHKGINVTNYERLHNYKPEDFAAIVLDECFPPDTLIDTVNSLDNSLERKYIKDIVPGDLVLNASGVDRVQASWKRHIKRAVRISCGRSKITCSENHPFFTVYGWKSARDLQPGDFLVETTTAMRMVRGSIPTKILSESLCSVLRDILLSEMANGSARNKEESSYCENVRKFAKGAEGLVRRGRPGGTELDREATRPEAFRRQYPKNDRYENPEWNLPAVEGRARRKWETSDSSTGTVVFCSPREGLETGVRNFFGETTSRISYLLQGRYRQYSEENSDRNRWENTRTEEEGGRKERSEIGIVGVDSIEVLESGHPDLAPYRDAEGSLYFYDLTVERHPSFSVNGLLVHNSGSIKNFEGKFRQNVTRFMSSIKYRLLATATPAPNDFMELGTSSEALGSMTRSQMLSMFFTNDGESTQQWRLKGHAKGRFWSWVGMWARALRKPSDLGFDDTGFDLPPLTVERYVLPSGRKRRGFFPAEARTLAEIRAESKATLIVRCEKAASLVLKTGQCILWCHRNDEGDLLQRLIPGAVQVAGKDSDEEKEERLTAFAAGDIRVLVTKPRIAGWGLNLQKCSQMVYFPSFSFESYYQAIRRCWRYGQLNPVTCHLVASEGGQRVLNSMLLKEKQSSEMYDGIVHRLAGIDKKQQAFSGEAMILPPWLGNGRNGR